MMSSRESATVGNLRALTSANATYSTAWGNGFAPTLTTLAPPSGGGSDTCDAAGLVDAILASGSKSQFTYTYNPGTAVVNKPANCGTAGVTSFEVSAVPVTVGKSGRKSFCLDSKGTIHNDPTGAAITDDAACMALAPIGTN
jgi:type IV pilus assembly protein PilA